MTRQPFEVFLLALLDAAIGSWLLFEALSHSGHRQVFARFGVYLAVLLLFKLRATAQRRSELVAAARSDKGALYMGPWWLRTVRLLIGYDSWLHVDRLGIAVISVIVCSLFGWDDGGPLAGAIFVAFAITNASLAFIAWGVRLSAR